MHVPFIGGKVEIGIELFALAIGSGTTTAVSRALIRPASRAPIVPFSPRSVVGLVYVRVHRSRATHRTTRLSFVSYAKRCSASIRPASNFARF